MDISADPKIIWVNKKIIDQYTCNLKPRDMRLLSIMINDMDNHNSLIRNTKTLAREMQASINTVLRAVNKLKSANLLTVEKYGSGKRYVINNDIFRKYAVNDTNMQHIVK